MLIFLITDHGQLNPNNSETVGYLDREWSIVYFHILTHQLAGVQNEYNHKQTVYGTSTIRNNILYIESDPVQL